MIQPTDYIVLVKPPTSTELKPRNLTEFSPQANGTLGNVEPTRDLGTSQKRPAGRLLIRTWLFVRLRVQALQVRQVTSHSITEYFERNSIISVGAANPGLLIGLTANQQFPLMRVELTSTVGPLLLIRI